jgi:hypothetical protein
MCDNLANLVVDYILCDFEAEIIKNDKELFHTQLDFIMSSCVAFNTQLHSSHRHQTKLQIKM